MCGPPLRRTPRGSWPSTRARTRTRTGTGTRLNGSAAPPPRGSPPPSGAGGAGAAVAHREAARPRYEVVTARWPSAEFAGVRDATKLVEMSVQARGLRFAVVAVRRDWLDPGAAGPAPWGGGRG